MGTGPALGISKRAVTYTPGGARQRRSDGSTFFQDRGEGWLEVSCRVVSCRSHRTKLGHGVSPL
jgi:hypothetical protein